VTLPGVPAQNKNYYRSGSNRLSNWSLKQTGFFQVRGPRNRRTLAPGVIGNLCKLISLIKGIPKLSESRRKLRPTSRERSEDETKSGDGERRGCGVGTKDYILEWYNLTPCWRSVLTLYSGVCRQRVGDDSDIFTPLRKKSHFRLYELRRGR
jgi:hypothetical protein